MWGRSCEIHGWYIYIYIYIYIYKYKYRYTLGKVQEWPKPVRTVKKNTVLFLYAVWKMVTAQ